MRKKAKSTEKKRIKKEYRDSVGVPCSRSCACDVAPSQDLLSCWRDGNIVTLLCLLSRAAIFLAPSPSLLLRGLRGRRKSNAKEGRDTDEERWEKEREGRLCIKEKEREGER